MRYAISYVSTANPDLEKSEVEEILFQVNEYNNHRDISGLLLYYGGHFFQLLEGDRERVENLYSIIKEDPRHRNITKFLGKPVSKPAHNGYRCDFLTEDTRYDKSKLQDYLNHIEVLDCESKKAVKRVLQAMLY